MKLIRMQEREYNPKYIRQVSEIWEDEGDYRYIIQIAGDDIEYEFPTKSRAEGHRETMIQAINSCLKAT